MYAESPIINTSTFNLLIIFVAVTLLGNMYILNDVVETDDIQSLKQAHLFSLLLDTLNNVSNAENLLLYCQYLHPLKKWN